MQNKQIRRKQLTVPISFHGIRQIHHKGKTHQINFKSKFKLFSITRKVIFFLSNMIQTRSAVNLLRNGISIERRVRKELIEQGILDAKDIDPPSVVKQEDEDEVLSEIKRVRSELVAIADFNTSELHKLQGAAKEEMKRLEIKRKLDDVDQEVIEQHKRILLAKQKGRQLTKQEREDILRLTEKQKKLSTELDEVQIPGYNLNFL